MRKSKVLILLIIFTSITFVLYTTRSNSTEARGYKDLTSKEDIPDIIISPGEDIQRSIDALENGGKLVLGEGIYKTNEPIIIRDKNNLTIEGDKEVWINTKGIDHHALTFEGCRNVTLFNIKAQHVILEDIDNAPIEDARDGAVVGIIDCSNINLVDCELVGCGIYGVYAFSASPVTLRGCYLHDNAKSALFFETVAKTMHVTIGDCIIKDNTRSIDTRGDVIVHKEGRNLIEGP